MSGYTTYKTGALILFSDLKLEHLFKILSKHIKNMKICENILETISKIVNGLEEEELYKGIKGDKITEGFRIIDNVMATHKLSRVIGLRSVTTIKTIADEWKGKTES